MSKVDGGGSPGGAGWGGRAGVAAPVAGKEAAPETEAWGCILLGSVVSYLVRPALDSTYELIGECSVHGIMQGEAFNICGNDVEDFHLL
jgi:hypothetical protein